MLSSFREEKKTYILHWSLPSQYCRILVIEVLIRALLKFIAQWQLYASFSSSTVQAESKEEQSDDLKQELQRKPGYLHCEAFLKQI